MTKKYQCEFATTGDCIYDCYHKEPHDHSELCENKKGYHCGECKEVGNGTT